MTQRHKPRQRLYELEPQYHERVWGGQRLQQRTPPVGEAWIAHEHSVVRGGNAAGRTVRDLAAEHGEDLLGRDVAAEHGARFPLLIKLLDCADWLSVQVHPNDEQARRLVGPGEFGKTEAWHFLDVEPGACILAGVRDGVSAQALADAIRTGRVLDVTRKFEVQRGETVFIPAGTMHALGPGMLLYEVQQVSDTTYRVYDWDRPASAGRKLHIEESVEVTDPDMQPQMTPPPSLNGAGTATVVTCPYFTLDVVRLGGDEAEHDTGGRSAHVITVTSGSVEVECDGERVTLGRHSTVLVAGGAGRYSLRPLDGEAEVLRASAVPPAES